MTDRPGSSLADITAAVTRFRDARDWKQFHGKKDLVLSLVSEVGELAEHLRWLDGDALDVRLRDNRDDVGAEMADVLYWLVLLAHDVGIDLDEAFASKMRENERKYPVHAAKGSSLKYDKLMRSEDD